MYRSARDAAAAAVPKAKNDVIYDHICIFIHILKHCLYLQLCIVLAVTYGNHFGSRIKRSAAADLVWGSILLCMVAELLGDLVIPLAVAVELTWIPLLIGVASIASIGGTLGVDPKEAEKGSEQVGKADPEASESEEATEVLRVPRTPLEPPRESKPLAST